MTRIDQLRRIVDTRTLGDVGGQLVDLTTANMLVTVYDALKTDEARDKFERLNFTTLVNFGWKAVR